MASGGWRVGESASQRVNPPGFAPVGSVIRQPPATIDVKIMFLTPLTQMSFPKGDDVRTDAFR
ncbi:MAG: hypothetical protein KKD28_09070, partial [Chloroflexi bacterium]|nr:hypothetical protein [Chloroflexota bacterium]